MPSRSQYTALPPPDTSRELEDAFGSDNEDDDNYTSSALLTRSGYTRASDGNDVEGAPLLAHLDSPFEHTALSHPVASTTSTSTSASTTIPGAYDFEREYDHPPPGSPPRLTATALPNDYGNSNGLMPTEPPSRPAPSGSGRPSLFRRALGAFMPTQYARLPTEGDVESGGSSSSGEGSRRLVGGGVENDGVFANVMAKPTAGRTVRLEDGTEVYMAPEESTGKEGLPSYQEAQLDSVPTYRETVLLSPAAGSIFPGHHAGPNGSFDASGSMIIDSMATGSIWLFLATMFISFFFQFIGFMFTYLLHTTHAAKHGSRAGLGLTMIQLGFYSRGWSWKNFSKSYPDAPDDAAYPGDVTTPPDDTSVDNGQDVVLPGFTGSDWIAFLLMTLGWFLLLTSTLSFWRVKRWERSLTSASTSNPAPSREEIERDIAIRRNLASVFGLPMDSDEDHYNGHEQTQAVQAPAQPNQEEVLRRQIAEARSRAADERLTRDLRAAGLL